MCRFVNKTSVNRLKNNSVNNNFVKAVDSQADSTAFDALLNLQ